MWLEGYIMEKREPYGFKKRYIYLILFTLQNSFTYLFSCIKKINYLILDLIFYTY